MKILVTGGAGFIGSHLCEKLLSEGHRVVCLDNLNAFYSPSVKIKNIRAVWKHPKAKNFRFLKEDIRDLSKLRRVLRSEKPALVVHLAAMPGVRPSIENPKLYAEVNIGGTISLLEACRNEGVKKIIFGSSSSVYGNSSAIPFSEKDPNCEPISPYAATKKTGEEVCRFYARVYGMNITALRFFTVYGPRQRPDLAIHKFTRCLFEDKTIPFYGDGRMRRDYTYVEDIVSGVYRAVLRLDRGRSRPEFEIFNLGESEPISLKKLVHSLERATQKKARLKKLPAPAGDVRATWADVSKARRVLGYRPKTNFQEGSQKFVEWYRREF